MTPEQIAELETSATAAETAAADAGGADEALNKAAEDAKAAFAKAKAAPSQESKKTERQKLTNTLIGISNRAKEIGIDPAEVLGLKTHIETDTDDEDDKPVTVGMLRDIQKKDAQTTAIQLADEIADEQTRATVKTYLSDRIRPSGNAEEDFKLALAAASAEKNKEIRAHISSIVPPKRTAAGGSAPARVEEEFTPTAEESRFMQPPYNLSKEKVIAARKRATEKGQ